MFKKLPIILSIGLAFSSVNASQNIIDKTKLDIENEPPLLKSILQDKTGNYVFIRKADMGNGMYAYILKNPKKEPVVIYKTPNNRLVLGNLINIDGTNQNKNLLVQSGLIKTDFEKLEMLEKESYSFSEPSSEKTNSNDNVYVFFDPFCPYCKKIGQMTNELKDKGMKLKDVKWIPVDFGFGDAKPVIQSVANDYKNLNKVFNGNPEKATPESSLNEKVSGNQILANTFKVRGVPHVVYMKNNKLESLSGAPRSMNEAASIFAIN